MQKIGGIAFGALLLLLGAAWIGQGLGYIKGSFMTGAMQWFWIGLACAVVGAGLLVFSVRRRSTT
ncbi:MAG TPA: hypothetical protein VIN01_03450 [Candidatus Dormibacteraeota bacterium]